ncbi:MAG: hypothetical protein ACE5LC_03445 [Candidatus Aminicenantales bacterium]
MRKAIIIVMSLIFLCFACKSNNYLKIKVEVPGITRVRINNFSEILITNFLIKKESNEFNLNKELVDFFSAELGMHFNGKIESREIQLKKKDTFSDQEFWKNLISDSENVLIFTGSAEYSQEIRKAILKEYSRRSEEFTPQKKGLAERKFYTLQLSIFLIDGATGKALYEKNFKESRGYENKNQTAYFAFFDLAEQIRVKLFRNILGLERVQQRYLISK